MKKVFSILMIALMSIMTLNAGTYGIIVNGKHYFAGTKNPSPGDPSFEEYMAIGVPLKSGDVLALYNEDSKDSWAVTLDQSSTPGISKTSDTQYSCTADGCYDFYIKLKYQQDQLYVGKGGDGCSDWGKDISVVTEPTVTDITITGDKYVGTELTFAATVDGFSATPQIIYEVKAAGGEYEQAQGGKFTPAAAGDYTVKATASYIPEEGDAEEAFKEVGFTVTEAPKVGIVVNVTVPDGTPACYFYGEMSGNTFAEMTKVDATHYTIEFPQAVTIGWGYLFCWEEGNWDTKNADPEGDITTEPVNGVVTVEVKAWITAPQPADEGFGIIFSDGSTIKGEKNEAQDEFLEYKIEAELTANTTFQLYNFAAKESWTEGNIDEASTPNVVINGDNVYEATVDGKYTIYLKMYGIENNQVYIGYEAATGLNDVIVNTPVKKMMENGQLYIIRGAHTYDAQGKMIR